MGRQNIRSYMEVDMNTVNNNMKDEHQRHLIFVIMLVAAIFYAIFVSEVKARGHIKHWGTQEGR